VIRSGIIPSTRKYCSLILLLPFLLLSSGCNQAQVTQAMIQIHLTADGQTLDLDVPTGSTVQQALDIAKIELNELDRTEPAVYTVMGEGSQVRVVRVTEEFDIEQVIIPFEQQTLRNESLPVEKEVLIQEGKTGIQEITYRRVFEDGVQVSDQAVPVKAVIVEEPVPEIRMIGVQTPLAPVDVPGTLYYLRDGNVWKIEGNTANRKAILTLGDLDGRILSLSEDNRWLIFTRRSNQPDQINTLWAADISGEGELDPGASQPDQKPIELGVKNVTQFADFVPGAVNKVIFSTVEPRDAAPGWQANNDLNVLTFSDNGWTTKWTTILEPNAGGVYGWWGTSFLWGPDSLLLAYTRADSAGIVDYQSGTLTTTLNILPLQTHRDWAWVPGITWGPDGKSLYTIDHIAPAGASNPEESQVFDLTAVLLDGGPTLHLVSQTGMFAYPLASPLQEQAGSMDYQIAYLQALFPDQSETSRYRVTVMDRDGSNRVTLFPPEDKPGMEPQQFWGAWSPAPLPGSPGGELGSSFALAVIQQGNLWIVNTTDGEAMQITGDGLTTRVMWR
jgi:resuscitation-promoting factor RpfB